MIIDDGLGLFLQLRNVLLELYWRHAKEVIHVKTQNQSLDNSEYSTQHYISIWLRW